MSEKISYRKIDQTNGNHIIEKTIPSTKFVWTWAHNEKKIVIILTILFWAPLFFEYMFMNLQFADKMKGLSDGWFGLKKDTHDIQWNAYNDNLMVILVPGLFHLFGSYLIKKYLKEEKSNEPNFYLVAYNLLFGVGFLLYMFQAGFLFWFILVVANYLFAKQFRSYYFYEPLLWVVTVLTLYSNQFCHLRYVWIHESLQFLDYNADHSPTQWYIMFNLTILRVMSFCLDYSWSSKNKRYTSQAEHLKKCHICNENTQCYKTRQETHAPSTDYNFFNYLSYIVYNPLLISGPVATFNAWISQIRRPQNTYTQKQVWKYVLRTYLDYIAFQIFLHIFYACALSTIPENAHIWQKFSLRHLGLMSFIELLFLWFKFLLIWRIPRAWALLDGIEVPENMNRCICNNYNFEGFWRSWHRGFNQWLIRYIFIPLGGTKYKLYNIWVVFSFVAIWHDFNINLIVWAWGICIALMPEMLIRWYFWLPKNRYLWEKSWWKYVCALAGGLDIFLMIVANLIGFGIGWNGLLSVLDNFMNFNGAINLGIGILGFSIAALDMFMIRERETDADKGY